MGCILCLLEVLLAIASSDSGIAERRCTHQDAPPPTHQPLPAAAKGQLLTAHRVLLQRARNNVSINHQRPMPLLLHQSWKSCTPPPRQSMWRDSCAALNPGWLMHLWTDGANRMLVEQLFPDLLQLYDSYDVSIKRVDAVRLMYLYAYGGVYMDLDFACLKPLLTSGLLQPGHFVAGYQLRQTGQPHAIANAFMASPPGHPFVAYLLSRLQQSATLGVLAATGPVFLTQAVNEYIRIHGRSAKVVIHEMPTIYPFAWNEENECSRGETAAVLAQCTARLANTSAALVTFWTHKETWRRCTPVCPPTPQQSLLA